MSIERHDDTSPTTQTWAGPSWTIEVVHGRTVDGYAHGHRRLAEALNLEVEQLTADQRERLGVRRITPTATALEVVEDGVYAYTAPRSDGVTTITAGRKMSSYERARLLVRVLRNDDVHPRTLQSRGVEVTAEDWPCEDVAR